MNDPLEVKIGDLIAGGILRNNDIDLGIITDIIDDTEVYYPYKILWLFKRRDKNYIHDFISKRDIKRARALYLKWRKSYNERETNG